MQTWSSGRPSIYFHLRIDLEYTILYIYELTYFAQMV